MYFETSSTPSITIHTANNGMIMVSIDAIQQPQHALPPRKQPDAPRCIKGFSVKSNNRMKRTLQTTHFDNKTLAITLPFPLLTAPIQAKYLYSRLRKWIMRNFTSSYGIYSVEFKNTEQIHYHIIACLALDENRLHEARTKLKSRWIDITLAANDDGFYMERVIDLASWLDYMCKCEKQRRVPNCFAGEMTRFWGTFGKLKPTASQKLHLGIDEQRAVRERLANIVLYQGHWRAYAYSCAIRQSSGPINIWLKPNEFELLLPDLTFLYQQHEES
jgi:hypothetical protein